LRIRRAPVRRFLFCDTASFILHFAAVEAHSRMIDCRTGLSSGTTPAPDRFLNSQASKK
jgi:hypothetical protein